MTGTELIAQHIVNQNKTIVAYEKVNETKSLEELAEVIKSLANEEVLIQGRTEFFNAELMASACRDFSFTSANALTRKYGIRQQAYMLYVQESKQLT